MWQIRLLPSSAITTLRNCPCRQVLFWYEWSPQYRHNVIFVS